MQMSLFFFGMAHTWPNQYKIIHADISTLKLCQYKDLKYKKKPLEIALIQEICEVYLVKLNLAEGTIFCRFYLVLGSNAGVIIMLVLLNRCTRVNILGKF